MRNVVMLVILAAIVYFGGRQLGLFSCSAEGARADSAEASGEEEAPRLLEVQDEKEDAPAPEPRAADEAGWTDIQAAVHEIASGRTPMNGARLASMVARGAKGRIEKLADAALAASSEDALRRWQGLSRLYEEIGFPTEDRANLLRAIGPAAKKGASVAEQSVEYQVVAGDSLVKICGKLRQNQELRVTPGILRWLNGLSGDLIRAGQVLRAPRQPVWLWISRSIFVLRVYIGDGLVAEYPVGLGKDDKTPAGKFRIKDPMVKAPWLNPETGKLVHFGEPGYAIGTRWLGFEAQGPHAGLGIHGTDEPASIGKAESRGCIRLLNAHVEELYELVPQWTEVTIVEGNRK